MRLLFIIPLLFISFFIHGQTQVLKKYNFDEGGYYLLGILAESDYNKISDSLKEWYTDDIQVLNEFKKAWTFTKESPMYSCGYHYMVNVCKGGESIESFHINLNCNVIATDTGYFYFDSEKLSRFQPKLKKPFTKSEYFKDTIKAKSYLKKIASDKTLILSPSAAWANHKTKNKLKHIGL